MAIKSNAEVAVQGRWSAFVEEYLTSFNARRAAMKAGYSPAAGARLLGDERIRSMLRQRQAELRQAHGLTLDMIVSELSLIGFARQASFWEKNLDGGLPTFNYGALTDERLSAAISSIQMEEIIKDSEDERGAPVRSTFRKLKFRLHDKRAALVDLANIIGDNPGRFEDDVNAERVIEMVMPTTAETEDRSYREGYPEPQLIEQGRKDD